MAAAHILVEVCETPLALPQLPPTAEKKGSKDTRPKMETRKGLEKCLNLAGCNKPFLLADGRHVWGRPETQSLAGSQDKAESLVHAVLLQDSPGVHSLPKY